MLIILKVIYSYDESVQLQGQSPAIAFNLLVSFGHFYPIWVNISSLFGHHLVCVSDDVTPFSNQSCNHKFVLLMTNF